MFAPKFVFSIPLADDNDIYSIPPPRDDAENSISPIKKTARKAYRKRKRTSRGESSNAGKKQTVEVENVPESNQEMSAVEMPVQEFWEPLTTMEEEP